MTWWMIALLAYFLPMLITVALIIEHGVDTYGNTVLAFAPLFNILLMIDVTSKIIDNLAKEKRMVKNNE